MSRKYKFKDSDKLYFVTFAVINWIDLFTREEYKRIMPDSWKYYMQNSARTYYGLKGLIEIDLLDPLIIIV